MSDIEKRIKIAERCGWTFEHQPNDAYRVEGWFVTEHGKQKWFIHKSETYNETSHTQALNAARVPDYLSDLNAMHEAEKVFNGHEVELNTYHHQLGGIVVAGKEGIAYQPNVEGYRWHATARQRADAFLKTIGEEV